MSAEPLYAAVFVAVVAGLYLLVSRLLMRQRFARRLTLVTGGRGRRSMDARFTRGSENIRTMAERATVALGSLLPLGEDDRAKIARSLQRAGFTSPLSLTTVLATKTCGILAGIALGIVWAMLLVPGLMSWIIGIGVGLALGVLLNVVPELIIARLGARRLATIEASLAETFDLLIVCLESGLTFERALQRTVRDLRSFHGAVAAELRQASLDMSVHGRTREDALGRMAARLDSQPLRDLASTVAQSERHGTPLADSLRKLAATLRVQATARMQAKMARLPVLIVLPTIGLVLPGILVLVAGPAMVRLTEELGRVGGGN